MLIAKSEPVALVDLDGTLADFTGAMAAQLAALAGPTETWDYERYDQDDEPDYMRARRRLIKSVPGFWRDLKPIPSGFRILEILRELDFNITIFTKAPMKNYRAFMEKAEWCNKHLADYPNWKLSMVQDKGLHYGKVLVDDWPPYIKRWLEFRPRGTVIMPMHKYNEGFEHKQVIPYYGQPYEVDSIRKLLTNIRVDLCLP